jgi:hypothetical protein
VAAVQMFKACHVAPHEQILLGAYPLPPSTSTVDRRNLLELQWIGSSSIMVRLTVDFFRTGLGLDEEEKN